MPAHYRALWWSNVGRRNASRGSEVLFFAPLYRGGVSVLQILLAEDNEGDVLLVQQALAEHQIVHTLHVVVDGDEALKFLDSIGHGHPCPDILLLDLNLPKVRRRRGAKAISKPPGLHQNTR